MNKQKFLSIFIATMFFVFLSMHMYVRAQETLSEAENQTTDKAPNFVYESIELLSLVIRLAGDDNVFGLEDTPYQRSLAHTFGEFYNHPVMEYARTLGLTRMIDVPMTFAIHLEKVDGEFQFIYGSSFWEDDELWTPGMAEEFLILLNDFYRESAFSEFFERNMPYFEEHSQRLYDELLSQINFDWFYQFGFGREDLRVAVRPSGTFGAFGPTLLNTVNYAIFPERAYYGYFSSLQLVVHEFAHSFANPIAEAWYEENEEFRLLSQRSVNHRRMPPWYNQSITVAREYVTRAYTILYLVENHNHDPLPLLLDEYNLGFTHIDFVYAMITEHEPMITTAMRFSAFLSRNQLYVTIFSGSTILSGIVAVIIICKRRKFKV